MAKIRLADMVTSELETVELRPPRGSRKGTLGREVSVHHMDGVCADLYEEYLQTKKPSLLWQLAAHLIPDATPVEVKELQGVECMAIVAIASGKADEVLAAMKADAGSGGTSGNRKAPTRKKAKVRRRGTGSPS